MTRIRYNILILISALACILPMRAFAIDMQASLITCYPGPEVYELVGHEAIRIKGTNPEGEPIDSVWNYGVFDFNTPGFIYRFVKGETDYMVWGYPFVWFIPQYVERGSKVVEQDLNLSDEETLNLLLKLRKNALKENRTYRYNYVRDNCSTRVAAMLDSAVKPQRIIYPDSVVFSSFRDAMRHYHKNYPWYQFGIDLALGGGIDTPVTASDEQFAPLRLMELVAGARFADSDIPLVKSTEIIFEGKENAILPATPPYLTPMAVMSAVMVFCLIVCIYEIRTKRIARWWMSLYFLILGLAGCLIWFLVFISTHEATSPNLLCLWLNPLQLVIAICIWWRVCRPLVMAMCVVNILILILLVCVWPFQAQSANPAIFPLWIATLALSTAYAWVYPYHQNSGKGHGRREFTRPKTRNRLHVQRGVRGYRS